MADRHGDVLEELAGIGMRLARGLEAQAVKSLAEAERLALAYHRVSRAVRLTLALEVRLERERRLGDREDFNRVRRETEARTAQVRSVVRRELYAEREACDAEALLGELDARLDEAAQEADFIRGPVEALIVRLREDLGLAANDAGLAKPDWRSSA